MSVSEMPVRDMLGRLLAGDPEAAAWLYDTFAPSLYPRLRRRYGYLDGLETDDLLQDAYLFFFQKDCKVLRDLADRSSPRELTKEYLEKALWDLACGLASNRRRSARRKPTAPLIAGEEGFSPGRAEGRTLDRDLLRRILACLGRSGSDLLLYLKLRFVDGRTPREIAALTRWTTAATYRLRERLDRALKRCAEAVGLEVDE